MIFSNIVAMGVLEGVTVGGAGKNTRVASGAVSRP
jgi:hypothetical protein